MAASSGVMDPSTSSTSRIMRNPIMKASPDIRNGWKIAETSYLVLSTATSCSREVERRQSQKKMWQGGQLSEGNPNYFQRGTEVINTWEISFLSKNIKSVALLFDANKVYLRAMSDVADQLSKLP